jgi:ABC-type sugar transport system ATPase subunit
MIAGLEDITSGEIAIDGRIVNELDPKDRDVAMVFQDYALYPHMTVFENMAFSLRYRGVGKAEIRRRVDHAARILDIDPLVARMPRQLSGGQRQRVAMGRAIVRDPKVFLFDEPLSNLDAKLRVQMRTEIKLLRERVATTTIYVTHDQVEAMTLADRIVILNHGRIEQIGTPEEVYDTPATVFVAAFIGAPPMNLLPARIGADREVVLKGTGPIVLPVKGRMPSAAASGHTGGRAARTSRLACRWRCAVPERARDGGRAARLRYAGVARCRRHAGHCPAAATFGAADGDDVALAADPANIHFFDRATGARL